MVMSVQVVDTQFVDTKVVDVGQDHRTQREGDDLMKTALNAAHRFPRSHEASENSRVSQIGSKPFVHNTQY